MLGSADRIVVMKEQTTIVSDGRNTEAVEARIKTIRKEVADSDSTVSQSVSIIHHDERVGFWLSYTCGVLLLSVIFELFVSRGSSVPQGPRRRRPKTVPSRWRAFQEVFCCRFVVAPGSFACCIVLCDMNVCIVSSALF